MDELPPFLRFTPVPVRAQHNGWSPELQLRFVVALARGAGPDEAARALGRTRQSVYRLRNRPDGAGFAAAWDRALAFARSTRSALNRRGPGGIETVLVPRYYRGRLVGFVQREDMAGAMRLLARLDRIAERIGPIPSDYATDEYIDEAIRAMFARSDRSDETALAKASISSTPERMPQPLDGRRGGSPPYARTRKESPSR